MNIQEIQEKVAQIRKENFNKSNQLSLGKLIEEIKSCGIWRAEKQPKLICFDFGSAIPTSLNSWRGSYDELALGYALSGYDGQMTVQTDAERLLTHLKEAIGKTYEGWKGGHYKMTENTPVWVANVGNSGNTAIIGVYDDGYRLVILTCYCEF